MTTICYKDGILAGDGRATCGDIVFDDNVEKIRRVNGGWVGCAGSTEHVEKLIKHLTSPGEESKVHNLNVSGILMQDDGCDFLISSSEDEFNTYKITGDYWAIGSGREIAIGAMESGMSALQAVRIAAKKDIYSGGRIQSVKRGQKK